MNWILRIPRALGAALLFASLAMTSASAEAQQDGGSNPHWSKKGCPQCHIDAAPGSPNAALKPEGAAALCAGCHGDDGDAQQCAHASGIPAGEFAGSMPESYQAKLQDGQVVCTTCHDLAVQCLSPKKYQRYKNPGFVRDGRFRNRADQCFLCHAKSGYRQPSPHMQVRGKDKLKEGTCLLCHQSLPPRNEDGAWGAVDFNMLEDLSDTCLGCHNVGAHPGTAISYNEGRWIHLVEPPEEIERTMEKTMQETGAILPRDPNSGKVFCGTCHNPHDKKLAGYPVAEFPGEKKLRVANICGACHEK